MAKGWNKGLTKETNVAVARSATALRARRQNGTHFKMQKQCRGCESQFTVKAPKQILCLECAPTPRDRVRWTNYGLTHSAFKAMLANQDNKCLICFQQIFDVAKRSSNQAVVDHDHATGKVRGVLCHRCNLSLGWAEVYLKRVVDYLDPTCR